MSSLIELEPRNVWQIFADICAIPHPSGHEQQLVKYICNFASGCGCEVKTDYFGNLLIEKAASAGFEQAKTIVLQAHLDMVTQKNRNLAFDFNSDPIIPLIEGNSVTACGTTLGADNGIGVAVALAIIADRNIVHGPLQCIFTLEEETGLHGAANLASEFVNADIMLNLDGENLKEIYIGCAGGARTTVTFDYKPEKTSKNYTGATIAITGMKGGHSGADINSGRGNSHKEMGMFLAQAAASFKLELNSLSGGTADNAIPRESFATVALPDNEFAALKSFTAGYRERAVRRLGKRAPEFKIEVAATECPESIFPSTFKHRLIQAVNEVPDGVIAMSKDVPGMVETSTNLAIITTSSNQVIIQSSQRSSINSQRQQLCLSLGGLWEVFGGSWNIDSEYPGWAPRPDSEIIITALKAYRDQLGFTPEPIAIHAGLECGIIGALRPEMEIISFGPDISSPHSPDERVNIDSVAQFWLVLLEILKQVSLDVPHKAVSPQS